MLSFNTQHQLKLSTKMYEKKKKKKKKAFFLKPWDKKGLSYPRYDLNYQVIPALLGNVIEHEHSQGFTG